MRGLYLEEAEYDTRPNREAAVRCTVKNKVTFKIQSLTKTDKKKQKRSLVFMWIFFSPAREALQLAQLS